MTVNAGTKEPQALAGICVEMMINIHIGKKLHIFLNMAQNPLFRKYI